MVSIAERFEEIVNTDVSFTDLFTELVESGTSEVDINYELTVGLTTNKFNIVERDNESYLVR